MKKRILAYHHKVDEILEHPNEDTDWEDVLREHLVQVGFFQHERLVHLLVLILFALFFVLSIGIALIADYLPMLAVTLLVLVLLVPYISHYYLLENEVQYMYRQYDKILENVRKHKEIVEKN
jgi:hypothetical protein